MQQITPLAYHPLQWVSLDELAHILNRPYRTVYGQAITGTLAAFGIPTYQDSQGRWWAQLPPELT